MTHEHRDRHFAGYPTPVKLRSSDSALTLPLSPITELQNSRHTASSQNQCLLLMKLPLELRKIIWERCIGGKTLHFTIAHYRGEKQSKLVHIFRLVARYIQKQSTISIRATLLICPLIASESCRVFFFPNVSIQFAH
ncbi:hypothetical protein EYC84_002830 [Monilinia fructicola]|uniref:DUF7730 domain-containing protein n=1 Tax=Monilinia fructicola TaxID=38448 RepID=A0A5M9JM46_MONFR|nr:hypothetical protein EYC84_002830 [Monilinia fructicola]